MRACMCVFARACVCQCGYGSVCARVWVTGGLDVARKGEVVVLELSLRGRVPEQRGGGGPVGGVVAQEAVG